MLTSLGYQVRRIGSYYTTREMDSLRIKNRRTWFRYSEGKGGDAIDFLQHFEARVSRRRWTSCCPGMAGQGTLPTLPNAPRLFSGRSGLPP